MAGADTPALFTMSGIPAIVEYTEAVLDELSSVEDHLHMVAAWMTTHLQETASRNTDWAEVAEHLQVAPDEDGGYTVYLSGSEEVMARVQLLEYGDATKRQSPMPFLRQAVAEMLPAANIKLDHSLDMGGI